MNVVDALAVPCLICCAPVTEPCQDVSGSERSVPHLTRMFIAEDEATTAGVR